MAERPAARSANPRQRRRAGAEGPTNKERDYLEVIYYLSLRVEPVIAAHLARWLSLQPPTVSYALQEMEKKGYIRRNDRNEISLTATGNALAETIIRRHRLLECFLAEVVGVPWYLLHEEAVQLEHALSPTLEARIGVLVGAASVCPHGNPIPGGGAGYAGTLRLDQAEVGTMFTLRRIEEEAEEQTDLLRYLEAHRLMPGEQFFIPDASPIYGITLRSCNRDTTIAPTIAAVLWGDPSPIAMVSP